MDEVSFANCDFNYADFSYSNFKQANFHQFFIRYSDFCFASFANAYFENTNFKHIYVIESNFSNMIFSEAIFLNSDFSKGTFRESVFDNLCLKSLDATNLKAEGVKFEDNSTNNIEFDDIKLGSIEIGGSIGLPVISCQLEKQDSSLFKELIQYWPKINIIAGNDFSGSVENFKTQIINNEEDEVKKKKYELTLSYIKAMAELDGFV